MADIPPLPPPPTGAPPPPPMAPPPPYQGLPPGYQPPSMPPGSPGYMPPGIGPTMGAGLNLGAQIAGARSSIIVGVVGILVPIVTAFIFGGTVYYFYLLPIFGLIYGVRAITRGFVIGGIIGVVLNLIAGLVSLTAAGLINPGS
jgi:hypothetical protein